MLLWSELPKSRTWSIWFESSQESYCNSDYRPSHFSHQYCPKPVNWCTTYLVLYWTALVETAENSLWKDHVGQVLDVVARSNIRKGSWWLGLWSPGGIWHVQCLMWYKHLESGPFWNWLIIWCFSSEPIHPFCKRVKKGNLLTECTEDRNAVAICNLVEYESALPHHYQVMWKVLGRILYSFLCNSWGCIYWAYNNNHNLLLSLQLFWILIECNICLAVADAVWKTSNRIKSGYFQTKIFRTVVSTFQSLQSFGAQTKELTFWIYAFACDITPRCFKSDLGTHNSPTRAQAVPLPWKIDCWRT